MKIKLFTHGADLDGVGCAILAYLAFGRENVDVEYCDYDNVDEKVGKYILESEYFDYSRTYITDISVAEDIAFSIDNVIQIYEHKFYLFDHHATALWLNQYDWCEVRVNTDDDGLKTCGTELFYLYIVNYEPLYFSHCESVDYKIADNMYRFVQIVRDYDTWRWKDFGEEGIVCKQMNDLFYIYGREEFIDWALRRLKFYGSYPEFPSFRDEDLLLLDQKQKDIDRYIEKKDQQLMVQTDAFGYTYGVVFAEQYFSELGDRLCELHPELDYVAMIDICGGTVSYRTIREDLDVGGTIAHSFGGGGHQKAAGSTFDGRYMRELVSHAIFPNGECLMATEKDCGSLVR